MWETRSFLRKAWILPQGKAAAKEMGKSATRQNLVLGKEMWDRIASVMSALDSPDSMKAQCKKFAEFLKVDEDHQLAEDEENPNADPDRLAMGYETPDDAEKNDGIPGSGRGRKRKAGGALANTPKKAKGGKKGRLAGAKGKGKKEARNSKTPDDEDWE
jgi:cohesin loading factor subunit SCC2